MRPSGTAGVNDGMNDGVNDGVIVNVNVIFESFGDFFFEAFSDCNSLVRSHRDSHLGVRRTEALGQKDGGARVRERDCVVVWNGQAGQRRRCWREAEQSVGQL